MIVADTDVLIDFLAGLNPAAERVARELQSGHLHTTAVNRFELLSGAQSAPQERRIRQLLEAVTTLPLDQRAADQSAEIQRGLQRAGQPIGMADSLIAGIVCVHEGTLLTRNRRHFERVPALKLADLATPNA